MNSKDQELCDKIISPGNVTGQGEWVSITRNGSLFFALPLNRSIALETLQLYQPQRLNGRIFMVGLRLLVRLGIYRFFTRFKVQIGDKGLFDFLDTISKRGELGFVQSSQDAALRNLIGVYEINGELCVIKVGCGEARNLVKREYELMEYYYSKIEGLPKCHGMYCIEDGIAYVSELIRGRSPQGELDDSRVFKLLQKWFELGNVTKVSTIGCWQKMKSEMNKKDYARIVKLAELDVISPVMHGDFATWNIKINSCDEVKVLDWEFAETIGMPGWDVLHYHVQRMLLVYKLEPVDLIEKCKQLMETPPISDYLEKAGLNHSKVMLLESYFFYSKILLGCPRDALIEEIQRTAE